MYSPNLSCQTARGNSNDQTVQDSIRNADDAFFIKTYNIIMLINNDNYRESLYRMMKCITSTDKLLSDTINERKKLRVYNILDANIVPINFHALQRELPYSNIFNYSYTFEHFVKERFGVIYNSYNKGIKGDGSNFKFAEDQLVDILLNPYDTRNEINYHNTIYKLMVGLDGISSGRPKYLSDQLWNKVLLNTMYRSENYNINDNDIGHKNRTNAFGRQLGENGVGYKNNNIPLMYLRKGAKVNRKGYSEPVHANLNSANATTGKFNDESIARYNTYLVRNIEWFVHLQRCMRILMKEYLEWVDDPVVTKSNAVANAITEYKNDDVFDPDDF